MTLAAPAIPVALRSWLSTRGLTPRQLELVEWFHTYQQEHSMAPTMQEMADGLGVSKVTVFEHIGALCGKGVLARQFHKYRSLRLLWEPKAKDLAADCKRYRVALKHYAAQAVGGEVAQDALEDKR